MSRKPGFFIAYLDRSVLCAAVGVVIATVVLLTRTSYLLLLLLLLLINSFAI